MYFATVETYHLTVGSELCYYLVVAPCTCNLVLTTSSGVVRYALKPGEWQDYIKHVTSGGGLGGGGLNNLKDIHTAS